MSKFEHDDTEIQTLMNEAPTTPGASPELTRKLRTMAASARVRPTAVWRGRLVMAGACAVALGAFALTMMPTPASARTFAKVVKAVDDIRAFQFSVVTNEGGKQERFTMAVSGDRFSMRTEEGMIMHMADGKFQIYDPKENVVTTFSTGGLADLKQVATEMQKGLKDGLDEMDFKQMLKEYEAEYGKDNIKIGPINHRFGKSVYEVSLAKPNEPERVNMLVNADTDLPEKVEVQKRGKDGNWFTETTMEMQFDAKMDAELQSPKFPAGAKHVELDFSKMMEGGMKGLSDGKGVIKEFSFGDNFRK